MALKGPPPHFLSPHHPNQPQGLYQIPLIADQGCSVCPFSALPTPGLCTLFSTQELPLASITSPAGNWPLSVLFTRTLLSFSSTGVPSGLLI